MVIISIFPISFSFTVMKNKMNAAMISSLFMSDSNTDCSFRIFHWTLCTENVKMFDPLLPTLS